MQAFLKLNYFVQFARILELNACAQQSFVFVKNLGIGKGALK